MHTALQWRHNERDGVSNHRSSVCSGADQRKHQFRVTGLCEGNLPVTGGFPSQRASDAENVSIWWRHHGFVFCCFVLVCYWSISSMLFTSVIHFCFPGNHMFDCPVSMEQPGRIRVNIWHESIISHIGYCTRCSYGKDNVHVGQTLNQKGHLTAEFVTLADLKGVFRNLI